MKKYIILGILMSLNLGLTAQLGVSHTKGAKLLALGNAATAYAGVESLFSNQAGIAEVNNFGVVVSTERRFELDELTIGSIGIVKKFGKFGHLGLNAATIRFDDFQEQRFGLTYARKLNNRFNLAATIDYLSTQTATYGSSNIFSFEIGVLSKISDQLSIGAHIFSPAQVSINETNNLKTQMNVGINYQPSEKVSIYVDVSKSLEQTPRVHSGVDYRLNRLFSIQVGMATSPAIFGFGLGFNISNMRINGAASRHSHLGTTPAISLAYSK